MRRLCTHIVVIATLLTTNYASADSKRYSVTGVAASTTLALYAWPDHSAERINTIPHDAKDISATGEFISLAPTNWIQVSWGNQTGWVDLALLKPMPETSAAVKASVITTQSAGKGFVYSANNAAPEKRSTAMPQPVKLPEPMTPAIASNQANIPWNNIADTIYHDPGKPGQSRPLQPRMSLAQASLTVARPGNTSDQDNGEMSGDRYGDINATMTVTYMDNGADAEK